MKGTLTADAGGGGGGGMSRAAKKRAKKRQKQQQKQDHVVMDEHDGDDDEKKRDKKEKKKKKRRNETMNGSEANRKKSKDHVVLQDSTAQDEETDDEAVQEQGSVEDPMDSMVTSLVSTLSPAQVLLLEKVSDTENNALVQGHEQLSGVNVNELLENMTSSLRARCLLQSLMKMSSRKFYGKYWEKQPLLVQASEKERRRLDGFLSLQSIQELMEKETLCFGRDLNVTKYDDTTADGVKRRITLDLKSSSNDFIVAQSKDVWSNYNSGCTIRLLCPHQHSSEIHSLLSSLELEWGCMVGANAYLTPPNSSQGFAPHYDDIEAFVLQLEGRKHWKVYPPPAGQALPRTSSRDFVESELTQEPVLDVVLNAGDVLYMPRGWIHQACTVQQEHSLHLTVSAMQNWAWVDYLELVMPQALEAAAASTTSTSLREGLPRNFLNYMGAIHDNGNEELLPEGLKQQSTKGKEEGDNDNDEEDEVEAQLMEKKRLQESFREEARKRIMRVCKEAMTMVDAGCDQIGKRFLSDRLPPAFARNEAALTSEGRAENGGKIWPNTMCRLVRPGIARLALEDDKAVLYHCVDNSCVYHGNPLSPMEFELDDAPALEALLTTVEPHWICVQDLIHDDIQDKMDIAQSLYDEGILAILQTETPDKSVECF